MVNAVTAAHLLAGMVQVRRPELLKANGGPLSFSYPTVRRFLIQDMGWTLRQATGAAQKAPDNWEGIVEDHHLRMASKVYAKSIPPELVFSMDETFVWLIPMGNATTFHKKGDSEVLVGRAEEKRGITASVTCDMTGRVLPLQLIY